jgi:hypothetical protein
MMDSDEREIYYYLKSWKDHYISVLEICRRAGGKKRHRQDPEWAKPVLVRMLEKGIVETDPAGHYRLKPMAPKGRKAKRWVSPQVAKILKESGKDFQEITMDEDAMDKFYDNL